MARGNVRVEREGSIYAGPELQLKVQRFDGWFQPPWQGIHFYQDDRAETPYGSDNRPDFGRSEVRQVLRDNAMSWLHEFRIDGLRFDSTIAIRKAVGKKIKEKIEAHRAKFIKGSVENGIDQSVAAAVYDDIEYFARYGFNKAHAADYAVMTCQTAYLKAHYPVEYMTALMTVEQSVEKIGLLILECRRLGIDVLRPDVNRSDLDFTIETRPSGPRAIRFGMASIKGVGEWSAHMLLIFGLQRPDVFPIGDLGLRKAMVQNYRLRASTRPARFHRIADVWRPWRSVATLYMWRSLDA